MRDRSGLFEPFKERNIEEMVDVLWEIHRGKITILEKKEIPSLFVNFNYGIIETTKYPQIESTRTYR